VKVIVAAEETHWLCVCSREEAICEKGTIVPWINGRFYPNPLFGRALERARMADASQVWSEELLELERQGFLRQGPGASPTHDLISPQINAGHWVTIDHRHVLIHDAGERIARTANKCEGSTDWAYSNRKGNFPPNTDKCNKYVYDVTKEAGAEALTKGSNGKMRPPLAAEWADPNVSIPNWRVLKPGEKPQPGDVAAYKLPGGGIFDSSHSGIVTSVDSNGMVHSIAAHADVVGPDDKFNSTTDRHVTYRRFTGDGAHGDAKQKQGLRFADPADGILPLSSAQNRGPGRTDHRGGF